jgi:hypothetical protein
LATISRRRGTLRGLTAIVDDDAFAQAERQARAFDKVLDGSEPRRALIARAAAEVNLTSRQVYNLLKRYAGERTVSSLLPRRGNARARRLNESVEAIIAATLKRAMAGRGGAAAGAGRRGDPGAMLDCRGATALLYRRADQNPPVV